MTKAEKTQHTADYKACFRSVCVDFNSGNDSTAALTYEVIIRMCMLDVNEREAIEAKILQNYHIDRSEFIERVVLGN